MTGEEVYSESNRNGQIITVYLYDDNSKNQEYLLNIEIDKYTFISGEFSTE